MTDSAPEGDPDRRQWMGFWSMIVQQTQNAFNDKAAQFVLIPLGAAVGLKVESWAGLLIALPFVLFAPLAGWVSDRFSKRDVMIGSAVLQLFVLAWICGSVWMRNLPLALVGFFFLAVQSTFFSPAKIGITKELIGSKHLGFGSGVQQMLAMLAILAGQIVSGWIYDKRFAALGGMANGDAPWVAALMPLVILTALAIPALWLAWIIPRVPAQGAKEPLTLGTSVGHFKSLRDLWDDLGLRRAALGVAFFWGFAAFINLWSIKVADEITGGGEGYGTLMSIYMAAASLGMAAGFGLASFLLRKRIELGWVPVSGVAMTVSALVLAAIPPGGWSFLTALALLAFCAAMFLAPLNAWMQDRYPAEKRGELQSAVNLQDCFAGILAVGLIELLGRLMGLLGVAPLAGYRWQMVLVGVGCGWMTWFILRLLPGEFIRVLGVPLIRWIYRMKTVGVERIPVKGGVLLLPNHVTFADAFFISAACPRPVRFVMDEAFMAKASVRAFVKVFRTVTIRKDQPREAIRVTIEALKKGEVLCLFPEGQLTRTGALCELKRGFELIARKAGHPLVPVWCDGSWGSFFSFEGGGFFKKTNRFKRQRLVVAFGDLLDPEGVTAEVVADGMRRASSEAMALRFPKEEWAVVNGWQIGQMNALERGAGIGMLDGEEMVKRLPGLGEFGRLFGGGFVSGDASVVVGDGRMREFLTKEGSGRSVRFFDFSERALLPLEIPGVEHLPCLAVEGRVVAMSLPNPPKAFETSEEQIGACRGTWGKLLPGWHLERTADGEVKLHGPAVPVGGLTMPKGSVVDEHGFFTVMGSDGAGN
jgi:acyl-[acyl-carrier-protein]-phospholipid O-acyltransferase/long-chain-fatty-acid--[acyl-carrier-protein] ligase